MDRFVQSVFKIAALGAVGFCFWFLYEEAFWGTLLAAVVAAIFTVLGKPDFLKSVQLGPTSGLKLELHELRGEVNDLRILAEAFARYFYWSQAANGRWSGPGDDAIRNIDSMLTEHFQRLGLNPEDLEEIRSVQVPFLKFDCAQSIANLAKVSKEREHEWREYRRAEMAHGIGHEPSPRRLREVLTDLGAVDETVDELLTEYQVLVETGHLRDPERWASLTGQDLRY